MFGCSLVLERVNMHVPPAKRHASIVTVILGSLMEGIEQRKDCFEDTATLLCTAVCGSNIRTVGIAVNTEYEIMYEIIFISYRALLTTSV